MSAADIAIPQAEHYNKIIKTLQTKVKVDKMKIKLLGEPKIIMSNPDSRNNYFAWPSVARLQNGKLAVTASGYRYEHVCPFGKSVISYSEDDGNSYTLPAACIDTPLDDRDTGILAFGKSGVLVTSFNNNVAFQRAWRASIPAFFDAYLDTVTPEDENKYLGSEFRISQDCGVTFGPIFKSPITSPHGPIELSDGTILWVGRTFYSGADFISGKEQIEVHTVSPDGTMKRIGTVPPIFRNGKPLISCEPYALELPDGTILCHIRVEGEGLFTLYQSISRDKGVTWSEPEQILEDRGGAPAHLLRHSSGILISVYGYRDRPFGIKAMFCRDNGKTWDTGYRLYQNEYTDDLGYPCTVELDDGTLLTVFYAHPESKGPAVILQQKWTFECTD